MITIISPAKTLDFKSTVCTQKFSFPDFINDSKILVNELRKLNPQNIADLMKVSNEIANLNFERYLSWKTPFTVDNGRQALLAFRGQVYIGMNASSFNENDLLFAQDNLKILSGLYGILRPLDLIQAYRLEMGIHLKNPKGKNLYAFWDTKITDAINNQGNRF